MSLPVSVLRQAAGRAGALLECRVEKRTIKFGTVILDMLHWAGKINKTDVDGRKN
jgi:hypothetical protein